jgi:hypothetical protein
LEVHSSITKQPIKEHLVQAAQVARRLVFDVVETELAALDSVISLEIKMRQEAIHKSIDVIAHQVYFACGAFDNFEDNRNAQPKSCHRL